MELDPNQDRRLKTLEMRPVLPASAPIAGSPPAPGAAPRPAGQPLPGGAPVSPLAFSPATPGPDRKGLRPAPRPRENADADGQPAAPAPGGEVLSSLRVPILGKLALDAILAELAQAMQDCRQLYLSCISPSPGFQQAAIQRLAASQDRLHRGLLAKIYATIAEADGRWTYEEQRCVTALLQHVGVPWSADQLEQTAGKIARQAGKLDWQRLLQPFWERPELRARLADLETLVIRIANLIAKADGLVAAKETAVLQSLQAEFRAEPTAACATAPPAVLGVDEDLPWVGTVTPVRVKRPHGERTPSRDRCLQKLDAVVGLRRLKQEIRALADWSFLQQQRRQAKLPFEPTDTRFLFIGRAGTGKTLIARLLSEILAASGVLKRGHLVEINAFDLVSREAADAANIVKGKLREAVGGTLLIEYAGAMFSASETATSVVLRALYQNLVAHAGRLAVILADHSDRLLGLLDRSEDWRPMFRRYWRFEDYHAGELGQIFQFHCSRSQYQVTRLAQVKLLLGFDRQLRQDAERFGFGHGVQRVFERAVHQLAGRIAGVSPLTKPLLTTFQDADIVFEGVPPDAFANLADPRRLFTIRCPGCDSVNVVGPEFLDIRVECTRCQHQFLCAWGEPSG